MINEIYFVLVLRNHETVYCEPVVVHYSFTGSEQHGKIAFLIGLGRKYFFKEEDSDFSKKERNLTLN